MGTSAYLSEIKEALAFIERYDPGEHTGRPPRLYTETVKQLHKYGVLAAMYADSEDSEIAIAAAYLKNGLAAFRVKHMPAWRRNWAAAIDRTLKDKGIEARAFGRRNRSLDVIGGQFADYSATLKVWQALDTAVELLRFGRVNFRKHHGADEYDYFALGAPPDEVL